jgi:RNA polymerase sigma-70 factor (ECF subfamily)
MGKAAFFDRSERFDQLVRPHTPALYRFAFRLLRAREDAEDLVQDVLTKLYPRTHEMAQIRELRPWLLRVLYRHFVDDLRRRRRSAVSVSQMNLIDVPDPTQEPDRHAGVTEMAQRIVGAIAQLNHEQQALIGLHLIDGMTLEEVTEVLDVPLGTLKSRLHRARVHLKKILQLEPFPPSKRVNEDEL